MDRGMRRDDFEEVDKFRRKANVLCWLLAICILPGIRAHVRVNNVGAAERLEFAAPGRLCSPWATSLAVVIIVVRLILLRPQSTPKCPLPVNRRRSQSYEPLLLENEREAVADLLQFLESASFRLLVSPALTCCLRPHNH